MTAELHVRRDGAVVRDGKVIGWTDKYRQRSGKWRGIKEGGRESGGFASRAAAAEWVVGP